MNANLQNTTVTDTLFELKTQENFKKSTDQQISSPIVIYPKTKEGMKISKNLYDNPNTAACIFVKDYNDSITTTEDKGKIISAENFGGNYCQAARL